MDAACKWTHECRVVAEPDEPVPEVHGLLRHDVDADALVLGLAHHVVLAGDVAQDGVRLSQLVLA